ncbi:MAG TPA: protein-L-isoaspartate(D-aspartate) O-methyltransferase [Pyrinomonadaceae bacterium]|nr:protein-L-isoaspartate(D-aspartate) O-methyltransferase [Pyrinomonadaceae bacterium]
MNKFKILLSLCLFLLFLACQAPVSLENSVNAQEKKTKSSWDERRIERHEMVEEQIRARGISSSAVLRAMEKVPRHKFVPEPYTKSAYADSPLPIGLNQTISQPFIVAYMTEAADISKDDKVLEIGTGSGYQAAILGEIAKEVHTIEIIPELAERSRQILEELGYKNIFVKTGNGYLGLPEQAPFDAIIVTAAPPEIPQALVDQLAVGGKMIIPVGDKNQEMVVIKKTKKGVTERRTMQVRFVPMTGKPSQ